MACKPMSDLYIMDYNDVRVKTVFPPTSLGIKLRKAGLSPGPLDSQADLDYLYQQLKLSLGIQMVESDKAK